MADSTVDVKITADDSNLQTNLNAAQGYVRGFANEIRQAGSDFAQGKINVDQFNATIARLGPNLQAASTQLEAVKSRVADAASASKQAAGAAGELSTGTRNLGMELRHGVALIDEFARGARGQMVSSLVAAARDSGHLGDVIAALKGPMGIALAAAAALAGGLFLLGRAAAQAAAQIREVSGAAALQGRNVEGAIAGVQRYSTELQQSGVLGRSSAMELATGIAKIPNITDQMRDKIAAVGEAYTKAIGGDAKKAVEGLTRAMESGSGLAHFADANNLMTASTVQAIEKEKGLVAAQDAVLNQLQGRLSGYAKAVSEAQKEQLLVMTQPGMGLAAAPPPTTASLLPLQFPQGTQGPSPQQRQVINDANAVSSQYDRQNQLLRTQKELETALATGKTAELGGVDRINAALKQTQQELDALAKKENKGGGTEMAQLEAALEQQLAASRGNKDKRLALEIQYWQQVLATTKLSAADQIAIQKKIAQAQIEQTDRGIAAAKRGAREAAAAARKSYEDFSAAERDKLESARGNFAQITAIYNEWLARARAQFGETSKEFERVQTAMKEAARRNAEAILRADEERVSAAEEHDRILLRSHEHAEKQLVAEHKITIQQMYASDIAYTQELAEEDKKRLQDVIKTDQMTVAERQKLNDQLTTISLDAADKIQEFQTQAAEASAKSWQQQFTKIEDQMASLAGDVLTHTKTMAQAFDDLAQSILKDLAGSAIKSALNNLLGIGGTGSGGGGGGLGSGLFNSLFGNLFGGGLSSLFGGGGSGDQDFASAAVSMFNPSGAIGGGGLFSMLGGLFGGGGTAGGGISSLLSFLPFLAFSKGGIVPSAAGGWSVPSLGPGGALAKVHSQEMVLPADISNGLQQAIRGGGMGGGGHTFNIGINALDAGGVAKLFHSHGSALVSALNKAMRNGAPALRGA